MTMTLVDLTGTCPPSKFASKINAIQTIIGLAPGTWPATGITNTLITALTNVLGVPAGTAPLSLSTAGLDGLIATIVMAGFLDLAATVTPDPPPQAADGTFNGWLDILADSRFDYQRTPATKGTGPVTLTNSMSTARGPFEIGQFHLAYVPGKLTYSNTQRFTIGASGDTTTTFAADVAGASSVVANTLTPVTSLVGVSVKTAGGANSNSLVGVAAQSNASVVASCRAKLQALGPKLGPQGAYVYFATVGYGGAALSAPVGRVYVSTDKYTGNVTVYIATANSTSSGGDATSMTAWLQAAVQPDGAFAGASAAGAVTAAVTLDAYVPAANGATAAADIATAATNYVNTLPIGGTPGPVKGLQLQALDAAIFETVPYLVNIENLKINGAAADLPLAASQIATASPGPVVTVHTF